MSIATEFKAKALHIYPVMNCNYRCGHCYAKPAGINSRWIALSLNVIRDYIQQAIKKWKEAKNQEENYWRDITFFGGEPFLRYYKLLIPALKIVLENGCNLKIFSNGYWGKNPKDALIKLRTMEYLCRFYERKNKKKFGNDHRQRVDMELSSDGFRNNFLDNSPDNSLEKPLEALKNVVHITELYIKDDQLYNSSNLRLFIENMGFRPRDIGPKNKEAEAAHREIEKEFYKQCEEKGIQMEQKFLRGDDWLTAIIPSFNRGTEKVKRKHYLGYKRQPVSPVGDAVKFFTKEKVLKWNSGEEKRERWSGEHALIIAPTLENEKIVAKACMHFEQVGMIDDRGKRYGVPCEGKTIDQVVAKLNEKYIFQKEPDRALTQTYFCPCMTKD